MAGGAELARRELARRELARRKLLPFIQYIDSEYVAGWAHRLLARRLELFVAALIRQESPRLMVFTPPRFGKSITCSTYMPVWLFGHAPSVHTVVASYGLSLPVRFSRSARALVRDNDDVKRVFPHLAVDPDNSSAEGWSTTFGGSYTPVGVGGGLSGKGAHCLILDDLLKDAEEADSFNTRESIWDWLSSTAYTRLMPGGGALYVTTRWSVDDPAGRLLTQMADNTARLTKEVRAAREAGDEARAEALRVELDNVDQWEVLRLRAIATTDEYANFETGELSTAPRAGFVKVRSTGEALHPERYSVASLATIRNTVQPRHWSALYQQDPVPDTGLFFETEKVKEGTLPPLSSLDLYIAMDTSTDASASSDPAAFAVVGRDPGGNIWLVRVAHGIMSTFDQVELFLDLCQEFDDHLREAGIESGPIEAAMGPQLRQRIKERKQHVPLASAAKMRPISSKPVRARPLQGLIQAGRFYRPTGASWWESTEKQMRTFPGNSAAQDDIVDAIAWAVRLALSNSAPQLRGGAPTRSWRDRLPSFRVGASGGAGHLGA